MAKVSVIIPAYNAEASIERCASSVLHQTLKDIEILFIDDGSSDRTGAILDEIVKRYVNARVIHQANMGIFLTRARAIREAKGEYIGWVDADDFIELDMFETLYNLAVTFNSELAYCDYQYEPRAMTTKQKWFRKFDGQKDVHYVERNSQFWNKLVKRDLLIRLHIPEMLPTCFEESMIKVLLKAENPVWTDKQLYHYTVLPGSMSSRYKNVEYYRTFICASENLAKEMAPVFPDKYWIDYFIFRIIYYYIIAMIVAANSNSQEEYKKLQSELKVRFPYYSHNQHFLSVMNDIYGHLKAIAIGKIVPNSYTLTNILCRLQFHSGGVQARRLYSQSNCEPKAESEYLLVHIVLWVMQDLEVQYA